MAHELRKNLKEFIAIIVLIVAGVMITYVILQEQRLRIPVLEERPFEIKAEFETAQAVVAGQGQTLRVAGVKIGDVSDVELDGGRAVVTFGVMRKYTPVYEDATILMRPTTGLKDMFFQLDPGTREAGVVEEGGTIPLANTAPDVNLDEILEALDTDTQAYLRLLLVGAGQGLDKRGDDLGKVLGSLGPINKDLKKINTEVAKRSEALRRFVYNFNRLTGEVGKAEKDLTKLVQASNASIGAIAERDPDVQRAVRVLPGTLSEARDTLNSLTDFAGLLGPTFENLRPFARNLPELNRSTSDLADSATPDLRDDIRPFVRQAQKVTPDLRVASANLARATPDLTTVIRKINKLGDMAAYNPKGAEPSGTAGRDEGYLYWAGWLAHNSNSIFEAQDAHGLYRRIYFTVGCTQALSIVAATPLNPIVTGLNNLFGVGGPFAGVVTPADCGAFGEVK